ncbi:MAG TPA: hypothetical protein VFD43_12265, partial [Planctomycetota bacterium]|nr:hypothetical protein [Planctomycetota bacterium]
MLTAGDVLAGIVLPAGVAAGALLAGRLARPLAGSAAVALGCGYLAGHVGLGGWRGWTPRESADWIALAAAAGLLAGLGGPSWRGPPLLRPALRGLLAFGVAWFVAGRSLARHASLAAVLGELALVAAVAAAAWWRL